MIRKPVKPLEYYCNLKNGFADCLERNDERITHKEKIEGRFIGYHDNYWLPKRFRARGKWVEMDKHFRYHPTNVCGGYNQKHNQAQGLVCR